ncbi:hypothetical protein [Ilumatobacter sp.]|uniref:hypothetical protein n=1 Tax=Ilumatobacter sp. TaxID=1967498 RepID=UPI003753D65D
MAGIPTVGVYIGAFGHIPRQMSVARALITPHPLGRPLGAPGDAERQLAVVEAATDLFEVTGATIREFPLEYRPTPRR